MAALNIVSQIASSLELKKAWSSMSASGDRTSGLMILIKKTTSLAGANIDVNDITAITIDFGLDSGETDGVLIIGSQQFLFPNKSAVAGSDVNDRASFVKINPVLPQKVYYRVAAIETKDKIYTIGDQINGANPKVNVTLNLEELDF